MKLLFDQNLPRPVARRLVDAFSDVIHVSDLGLESVQDPLVWAFARDNGWTICSKDVDFMNRSLAEGHPPRVVWIRLGNCSNAELEDLFRTRWVSINAFHRDPARAFLPLP